MARSGRHESCRFRPFGPPGSPATREPREQVGSGPGQKSCEECTGSARRTAASSGGWSTPTPTGGRRPDWTPARPPPCVRGMPQGYSATPASGNAVRTQPTASRLQSAGSWAARRYRPPSTPDGGRLALSRPYPVTVTGCALSGTGSPGHWRSGETAPRLRRNPIPDNQLQAPPGFATRPRQRGETAPSVWRHATQPVPLTAAGGPAPPQLFFSSFLLPKVGSPLGRVPA
jgi:hypothetical protein